MVEINGTTLLDRQISRFRKFGIEEIAVVAGYCYESVKSQYPFAKFLNERYESTNMAYSLFCAGQYLEGDTIISYGDIFYEDHVLDALLQSNKDISVAVDMEWKSYYSKRFSNPYDDGESLVYDQDYKISSIGKGNPDPAEVMAQYIGLIKVSDMGAQHFHTLYRKVHDSDVEIGWGRPFSQAYMTDFLQELIRQNHDVHAVPIFRGWYELDQMSDYNMVLKKLSV